ncbi:venus kinase receptor [Anopheles darlingi]|uniref:receptor protein-tyrosine kinase n=1 Tax=Anopheles darlingi TaxID=43151 RepID=W5JGP7_ANODA|nr:venus kinase receptor [Anopheles darlingi]
MVRVGFCSSSLGLALLLVAAYGVVLGTCFERHLPFAQNYSEQFQFECFPASDKVNLTPRFTTAKGNDSIAIQVSRRFTHQMVSRIYAIFLREVLGYQNVKLVEFPEAARLPDAETERIRQFLLLDHLSNVGDGWPDPTIDLEVWLLSDYNMIPTGIQEAGAITHPGRYGLFIPKSLVRKEEAYPKVLPYTLFQHDPNNPRYQDFIKKYDISESMFESIVRYAERACGRDCNEQGMFVPEQCTVEGRKCGLVLAPHYEDTHFLVKHIVEMQFQLKVLWTGAKLQLAIRQLMAAYGGERKVGKKFLVFYWTPSEVINSRQREYLQVTMPRCEEMAVSNDTGCKYELTPRLKYYARNFASANHALNSFIQLHFDEYDMEHLFDLYDLYEDRILAAQDEQNLEYSKQSLIENYNAIACDWMKSRKYIWEKWNPQAEKEKIIIGGIFPNTGMGPSYRGILPAALAAQNDINYNQTILSNYVLEVHVRDGMCKPDEVLKQFINYYLQRSPLVGVLGPACSETIEPIAGISKHFRMAVISYSAEGASLTDRETYPYFFRTIGENQQYKHVYAQLLPKLNWHRVAALTEDGQKATEYISYMEPMLKEHNIELISNKKFPRDLKDSDMQRYLLDLKMKNAKIIIADVDDRMVKVVMCHAYHLEMTSENGYIWFLPMWLTNLWNQTVLPSNGGNSSSRSCTLEEYRHAMNGHFSLSHAPFADDNSRLEVDGSTVSSWKKKYNRALQQQCFNRCNASDYAGYAYDAVWVYALALDKLLRNDPSSFSDLHSPETTIKLIENIQKTDFQGVSGRIRFNEAGSRYTIINVVQFINGTPNIVGHFTPNISESKYELINGELHLNESAIVWLTRDGRAPDDGAEGCSLDGLAALFDISCDQAKVVLITVSCAVCIMVLSVGSFCFWKDRYDRKMKTSAKYLQKLGIDLLSPSAIPFNTLDKWEIPKDRVVINRRLGEGAFGTVYGGEAQIEDEGWTAVAVKTLKVGSTTEDKVDFLSEAEAMKRFDHNNIVRLLGVCLQSEPVYTIMEFMLYGDLKTYLLARRHLVNTKQTEDSDISNKRLTMMALDVARALSYLAEQKYVHRDVACRNCMVNAQRVVKLGDFGMARPTFENDYYRFNRKGMLPVRWMAPESLALGYFTPAADVWSYGVLLYEIITFGSFPFQGMTNNQVLEHLKNGNTLTIPTGVKPQLEGLMKACWNRDHKKRPSASEVADFISNYPRLLNPCLDVPLASVEMVDTDSDQFELLPALLRYKDDHQQQQQPTADLLVGTQPLNDLNNGYNNVSIMATGGNQQRQRPRAINLNDLNVATDFTTVNPLPPMDEEDFDGSYPGPGQHQKHQHQRSGPHRDTATGSSSNGQSSYNPIEPLLQRNTEVTKSNNSLLRYMPMFGFGKGRTVTIGGTTIVTGTGSGGSGLGTVQATTIGPIIGASPLGSPTLSQSPTGSILGTSGGTMIVNTRSTSTTVL